jgi:hypothetical protein
MAERFAFLLPWSDRRVLIQGSVFTIHNSLIKYREHSMETMFVLSLLAVAFMFIALPAEAQGPVQAAPHTFKERLSNSEVRVLEYSSKPGQKEAMYSHPAMMLYVIQGGKLKSTTPDGRSQEIDFKAGDVMWRDAMTHSGENIGTTEMKALLIEVNHGKKK